MSLTKGIFVKKNISKSTQHMYCTSQLYAPRPGFVAPKHLFAPLPPIKVCSFSPLMVEKANAKP